MGRLWAERRDWDIFVYQPVQSKTMQKGGGGEKQPPDFGQPELWQTRQTCLTGWRIIITLLG